MILSRRDFLKTSAGALILPALLPKTLFAASHKIPVLLYHDISDQFKDEYTISPSRFAAQMERLHSSDYRAVSLKDLDSLPGESLGRAVVITFDDGYASFIDYAFPLLKDYGFKATLNIIGQYVGTFAPLGGNRPMLSWDEYRFLNDSGLVDLGCHTYNLHIMSKVVQYSGKVLEDDLRLFAEIFKTEIGRKPDILAWPFGTYDKSSAKIAERMGFKYLLTSREALFSKDGNLNEIPRLNINNRLDIVSFDQYIGESQ
jgi:peptidoglycan/xylan/chitin deacetylase (PgdA/CDA1 family)